MADTILFLEASGSWVHLTIERLSPHHQPSSLAPLVSEWQAWRFFFFMSLQRDILKTSLIHYDDFAFFFFLSAAFLGSKQKNFHNITQMVWLQETIKVQNEN